MLLVYAWLILNFVIAICFVLAGGEFELEELFETKEDVSSEFSPFWYGVLKIFFIILFLPTILLYQISIFIIFLFILIGWFISMIYTNIFGEK